MSGRKTIVPNLVSGTLTGLLVIFRDVSFALVYCKSAALAGSATLVMASLLVSSTIGQLIYTRCHSLPGCISCPSSTAVPFQGAIAAAIAKSVAAEAALPTVMVALAMTSMCYGALLALLSLVPLLDTFKSAFPQPVMLGFFAVCGVGMLQSSLELVHGGALSWQLLQGAEPTALAQVGLALLAGVANRAGAKLLRHFSVLPLSLLTQLALFHLLLAATSDLAAAREAGWLWPPLPPLELGGLDLAAVDWGSIAGQAAAIASLLSMLVLDLLTTLLPVELMTPEKSIQMAREFRIAGCSAAAAGAALGSVSYVSLSPTRLNVDAGGSSRASGLAAAAACLLWALVGMPLTAYIPKFAVGGLLLHLAFGYLLDGLWEPRALLSLGEYAVVAAIVLYYLVTDLAPAILMGLVLCCFSFILRYSQTSALEFVTTASEAAMVSNRPRPPDDSRYIRRSGAIVVARTYCSQLFFGSIAAIMAEVLPKLKGGERRFLVFDFASVRTMDSSALVGFAKLPPHVELVMVGLAPPLEAQVRRAALPASLFEHLDEGLEWCEDRLLKFGRLQQSDLRSLLLAPSSNNPSIQPPEDPRVEPADVAAALRAAFQEEGLEPLCGLFRPVFAKAHELVFEEGCLAEGLYVIARGALQVYYGQHRGLVLGPSEFVLDGLCKRRVGRVPTGTVHQRGRAVQPGDVLCEAALFVRHHHGYSLVAAEPSLLLLLTRDRMLAAEQQHPRAAVRLLRRLMILQHAETWLPEDEVRGRMRFASV